MILSLFQRCQKMCLQKQFIESCSCIHTKYPMPDTFVWTEGPTVTEPVEPCLLTAKGEPTKQQQHWNTTGGKHLMGLNSNNRIISSNLV